MSELSPEKKPPTNQTLLLNLPKLFLQEMSFFIYLIHRNHENSRYLLF